MLKIAAIVFAFVISSCGDDGGGGSSPSPPPSPGPGPTEPNEWKDDILPLLQFHCADCHAGAGFLQSKATFLKSGAPKRIENRTMPPVNSPKFGQWNDDIRQKILDYVAANR